MESQFLELIEFLICQQFVKPGDIITDRMKVKNVRINSSGRVIKKFITLLTKNVQDIIEKRYKNYLEKLNKRFTFDLKKVYNAFIERISKLDMEERELPIIITSLLGEILGCIRERSFNQILLEIKIRFEKQNKGKQIQDFSDHVSELLERNDIDLSLLYNLSFLEIIAEVVHSLKVRRTTKILLGKYMNRVVTKLS